MSHVQFAINTNIEVILQTNISHIAKAMLPRTNPDHDVHSYCMELYLSLNTIELFRVCGFVFFVRNKCRNVPKIFTVPLLFSFMFMSGALQRTDFHYCNNIIIYQVLRGGFWERDLSA